MSTGWKRWLSILKRKGSEGAASLFFQALTWTAASFVGPFLISHIEGLKDFLTAPVTLPIPWWAAISSALLATGLVGIVSIHAFLYRRRQETEIAALSKDIKRRDWRAKTFRWGHVEWPLTGNFWDIVEHTSADDFVTRRADPSLLIASIGDPLCGNPQCRCEIWPYAAENKCRECGADFQLGLAEMKGDIPANARFLLKQNAYRDARAEYFRRQSPLPTSLT